MPLEGTALGSSLVVDLMEEEEEIVDWVVNDDRVTNLLGGDLVVLTGSVFLNDISFFSKNLYIPVRARERECVCVCECE